MSNRIASAGLRFIVGLQLVRDHMRLMPGRLLICAVAFALVGPASAKLVVDQLYSNANGGIQFIVFRVQGELECGILGLESIHDGRLLGGDGGFVLPDRWTSGTRILVQAM